MYKRQQFVFENVYKPLGFSYMIKEEQDNTSASQEYKNLRQSYEEIRKDYEEMRKGYEGKMCIRDRCRRRPQAR